MKKYIPIILMILMVTALTAKAQEQKDYSKMNQKELMQISYDELLDMPFDELKGLAESIGISTDELLKMALNREVSSASKKGESVFESPLSTTVISKEEIKLTGATTFEELFRLVPGMIVRQESNGNFDIHIRGNDNLPPGNFSHFSENMMTLVMVDGRIVFNYINGGTIWESIPVAMTDIERIEIIRGASSALYGPNAVSGVINIITRNPNELGEHLHGNIEAGNQNTFLGNFSFLNRTIDKFDFKLAGAYDFRDRSQTDFYEYLSGEYVPADSLTSMFNNSLYAKSPNPKLSRQNYNINAGMYYDPTSEISIELNSGFQTSKAQSMFFENLATPFGIRSSKTGYADYKAKAYGFQAQVNYFTGTQNLHERMIKPVIEYDMDVLNANLEYDLVLNDIGIGELTVRPGVSYQLTTYDDERYVKKIDTIGELDKGFLNGSKELETLSGSMRIDYKPISKLRIIAALRADKYNVPDDLYLSWQFVSAYTLTSNHMVRATYSRANRGSFMGNSYANFRNPLNEGTIIGFEPNYGIPVLLDYNQYYMGSEELNLLTQDLFEVGYRGIITDYLQVDLEGFYSITSDFDALLPGEFTFTQGPNDNETPTAIETNIEDEWHYQNIDMTSTQMGASLNVAVQPMNNLLIKLFGTYQETQLKKVLTDISSLYIYDPTGMLPVANIPYDELPDEAFEDIKNEWTPAFYGGAMINYNPINKLTINVSTYFYGKQKYSRYFYDSETLRHRTIEAELDPNIIINAKIAYNVTKNMSVFVNARNLADHGKTELPYNDKMRGLYLGGINFSF
jgi:iron complex outermembrane receptor protein